jgi:hypothetical protein
MTSEADDERTTTAVSVVVSEAPDGLQKYTARIAAPADSEIDRVESGVLERFFEVDSGGAGAAFVRARAVDMTGEARRIEAPTALFTIHFTEPVEASAIQLHFETVLGHDGERVSEEALRFDALGE